MKLYTTPLLIALLFLLVYPLRAATEDTQSNRFVLVIDAGHGGRDAGAIGAYSKEKNINLRVALSLGKMVQQNCPDVKVIYTRQSDIFVPLDRRAEIANDAKANLFISIHTNALPKGRIAYGAETYTLGTARAGENLEVAKRENAVILYEEDYKRTYKGFDPNKAESYIIFELMQDQHMKQSINLAGKIQRAYKQVANRPNKGVHQAGFLVLRATSMPAVLTELGFISTPAEEAYLNSERGIQQLAKSIFQGFVNYKREHTGRGGVTQAHHEPEALAAQEAPPTNLPQSVQAHRPNSTKKQTPQEVFYTVQILTADRRLSYEDKRFKGITPTSYYKEGTTYKYIYGRAKTLQEALQLRRKVRGRFPEAFVIALADAKRITLTQAKALLQ